MMRDQMTEKAIREFKEKLKALPRAEREKAMSEILVGVYMLLHCVADSTARNQSLGAVAWKNINELADSKVTDSLLAFLVEMNNFAYSIKGDIRDARYQDMDCNSLCNRIIGYYNAVNTSFNKVYLFKPDKKTRPILSLKKGVSTVTRVDFKNKRKI